MLMIESTISIPKERKSKFSRYWIEVSDDNSEKWSSIFLLKKAKLDSSFSFSSSASKHIFISSSLMISQICSSRTRYSNIRNLTRNASLNCLICWLKIDVHAFSDCFLLSPATNEDHQSELVQVYDKSSFVLSFSSHSVTWLSKTGEETEVLI